ncbi:MAG: GAF domain-containing protein [Prolixibacteraceae bacterium]|nr:GAF domain-containing protein [Prolixibacteraceae bacterium]MBN2774349.1 GAF domain-containing protein [Prolixibacteraceae bacterium]
MEINKKEGRYNRIYIQLENLLIKSNNREARMATAISVLHHKLEYFFWTGFYMLINGELTVQMYQGPVACQILEKNRGVCWAAINNKKTIIVEDVSDFSGHIACDSRSKSEIAIPFINNEGYIIGVLDVDSNLHASFDQTDARWLGKILELINS